MKPSTPLPWHTVKDKVAPYSGIYSSNRQVTHENGATNDDNAAYIVHACNAYPRLVEALAELQEILDEPNDSETPLQRAANKATALLKELGEI